MIQNDVLGTAKLEGLVEGRMKGLEEGRVEGREKGLEEGRVEGREEGLVKGEERGILKVARNMKEKNMPMDIIIQMTGLTAEDIERL